MHTAIVILNWNTEDYLRRFLPGTLHSAGWTEGDVKGEPDNSGRHNIDVIVADSGSTDGSMDVMEREFPGVKTIRLGENLGFAGGYNCVLNILRAWRYDYYVLLNTDIEVSEGWIGPLIKWMEENPDYAACAPKLLSWYDHSKFEYAGAAGGYIDRFGYPFCRGRVMGKVETDKGQYSDADVFWATGACLMVRAKVFHEAGGFDKRFFAHQEEIDLCWRMRLEGWKIRVLTDSVVYHLGGGTLPASSPFKLFLNYRNNLFMLDNNLAKTLALKAFSRHRLSADNSAIKGVRQARRRIFERMVIDGCSAAVYLLTGKFSYFKSVLNAHKEFRAGRSSRETMTEQTKAWLNEGGQQAEIMGIYPHWMVPMAVFEGKRFFRRVQKFDAKNY